MVDEETRFEQAMRRAADLALKEMCGMEHPVHHVLCLRNIGHAGQHWFTVRWVDSASAIKDAADAFRDAINQST